MAIRRNIQYINKDFTELRASLIDYAKTASNKQYEFVEKKFNDYARQIDSQ
jgi:hypothetical protein